MNQESNIERRSDTEITRENLTTALESIGATLFDAGIVTVGVESDSTLRGIPEGIEINLAKGLQSIDSITLGFWNGKGTQTAEISIVASQNEGDHLSGPASSEVFAQRIVTALAGAGIDLQLK